MVVPALHQILTLLLHRQPNTALNKQAGTCFLADLARYTEHRIEDIHERVSFWLFPFIARIIV